MVAPTGEAGHARKLTTASRSSTTSERPAHAATKATGRRVAVENSQQEIERLRVVIWEQAQEIDRLLDSLAELEQAPQPLPRRQPTIY
jgi:hypothetical protein